MVPSAMVGAAAGVLQLEANCKTSLSYVTTAKSLVFRSVWFGLVWLKIRSNRDGI